MQNPPSAEEWTRLIGAEDIRRRLGIPITLENLTVNELIEIRDNLQRYLQSPQSDSVPAPVRRFLESEHYQISSQVRAAQQRLLIKEIRGDVDTRVEDPDLRDELSGKLDGLAKTTADLAEQVEVLRASDSRASKDLHAFETKWRARKAMLEREPAAVLVGGLLLLGIAVALIIAMFTHTAVPEILASGFLLILGFFFGQNSSRGGSSSDSN